MALFIATLLPFVKLLF